MKGAGNLDDDNAKILHQKTDDWFAELVLLLEGSGSAKLHSMSLPRRHLQRVFSYFASEILQHESLEHKEMLFYAALFKDINPVIVEKLSGQNGIEQYLSRLSHKTISSIHWRRTSTSFFNSSLFSGNSCLLRDKNSIRRNS